MEKGSKSDNQKISKKVIEKIIENAENILLLIERGIITKNEIREMLGLKKEFPEKVGNGLTGAIRGQIQPNNRGLRDKTRDKKAHRRAFFILIKIW